MLREVNCGLGLSLKITTDCSKPKGSGVPGRVIEALSCSILVTVRAKVTEVAEVEAHVGPVKVPLVI
jgi:hypothetical protein